MRPFKLLLIFSFILHTWQSHAGATRVEVYLNFNDCINCTSALGLLGTLPSGVGMVVVTDKKNFPILPEFLDQHGVPVKRVRMEARKHLDNRGSRFRFIVDGKTIMEAPLVQFGHYAQTIRSILAAHEPFRRDVVRPGLRLSSRVKYFTGDSSVVMIDYTTGRCFTLSTKAHPPIAWSEIRCPLSFIEELRDSLGVDPDMHAHLLPLLRRLGKDQVRFESAYIRGKDMFLGLSSTFPHVEENGDTALAVFYAIARMQGNELSDYWLVNPDVYNMVDGHALDVDDSFVVQDDSTFLVPLFKVEEDSAAAYLLATARARNGRIEHLEMLDMLRPAFYDSMGYQFNFGTIGMNEGYAFLRSYPSIIELSSGSVFDLRTTIESFFQDHYAFRHFPCYFLDWRKAGPGVLATIVTHARKCHVLFIDTATSTVLHAREFSKLKADLESVRFTSEGHVIALSSEHEYLLRNDPASK